VTHPPVTRAPEPYRSMEYVPPVEERRDADAEELPLFRPTARRSRRKGGQRVLLLAAAAALVVGTHLVLTAVPSASAGPAETPGPASVAGAEEPESPSEPQATASPRVTVAPARVAMTPGPAFAGSVPARPGADSAAPKAVHVPAPVAGPAEPSIAPAPAAIELSLPGLPPESIVRLARTGDTMGMKKILRALNGAKPAEAAAAP
jgi:hypothetical protein